MPDRDEFRAFHVVARASVLDDAADLPAFTIAKEHRVEVTLSDVSNDLV